MKKLLSDEKIQKKLLFVFLVLQPLLDCYLLYTDKIISIFHFSPTTLIRLFFVAFLMLIVIFGSNDKKSKLLLFIYGFFVILYTGAHYVYTSNLVLNNYSNFIYSTSTELLYILRMLLPIGMGYLAYNIKFTKREFVEMLNMIAFISSIIIVGFNIFKISLASYGTGLIEGNIFDWFVNSGKYDSMALASKGWFNSANQISGLFMLLFPFVVYSVFDEFKKENIITLILTVLAMIILGTRTASYGWVLVIILVVAIDIFLIIMKKKKILYKPYILLGIVLACGFVLLNFAPIVSQKMEDSYNEKDDKANEKIAKLIELANLISTGNLSEEEIEELIKTSSCFNSERKIETNCLVKMLSINPVFYEEIYPVQEHSDFWNYFMLSVPGSQKYGNRNIQRLIVLDIDKEQKKSLTPFLGYGYSRFVGVGLYLERDFQIHYYTIGILGIIVFLLPYVIMSVGSLIYMLVKKKFDFFNILLGMVILEILAISYLTGHILDELIVSLFLGLISGCLISKMKEIKDEKKC